MTEITVIILTKNETLHIRRAIASVQGFATRVVVVDSGSTDDTVALAKQAGAEVLHHPWTNYASQFNWALNQLRDASGWIMRLDADEVVTPPLAAQIEAGLPDVAGVFVNRCMHFMGQTIRHGGLFPVKVLRLFRNGQGRCEDRWMDEHIIVDGATATLSGEVIDDNHNSLDWWTAKHNNYASREVVDILNQQYGFMARESIGDQGGHDQATVKRWIKEHIYARLPIGARAGVYFFYRYILRLGFLDGRQARAFHVLQGFWYRYLVDAKLAEVRDDMAQNGVSAVSAIKTVLHIDLTPNLAETQAAA